MHDFIELQQGSSRIWERERQIQKIEDVIQEAVATDTLKTGQASKLLGCVTFLDQGVFRRVARTGLAAIKDRQYASKGNARLNNKLRSAFCLNWARVERVVAASDAAQEAFRTGSGGFLLSKKGWGRSSQLTRLCLISGTSRRRR